jgi:hypothetical protein
MAVFSMTSCTIGASLTWTGTAPGDPGTQTVSGTLASSTDLTAMIKQIDVSIEANELDYTNFASGGWTQIESGLAKGMVQFTFNQDFAASQVDARFGLGGTFGLRLKPYMDVKATSAARSATNPSYVFQIVNTKYQPLTGNVGDLASLSLQFPTTGQVARLTA